MSRIVVTGGTGYIGSHTVVELIQSGFDITIIDNLSNSEIEVLSGIERITGVRPDFENIDCTDYMNLDKMLEKYTDIEGIIHFAASKSVGESVQNPLLYYHNNISSLINLLELMPKHNIRHIVFSSSCTVYGQPDHMPVNENAPIKPALSPYGNTKQICEEIIRDTIHATPQINATILRYFNPIGAHPTALIGELPNGIPNNLLPFITQTAAGLRSELRVFGNDYDTPDGSCIRDYIYVVDLAKAHVAALQHMLAGKKNGQLDYYNLGTGRGLSVLEILDMFQKVNDVKVPYKIVERREGDIEQVWADSSKANKELNWKADTPLEDILRSCWQWELHLKERREQAQAQ
ncbi:MAG: UDP-glucose 4-epimerase GalE [Paludibacteraceae bacterium]|nr:UDP-glucose 4-epimerase GalE [Paludibacteraceae bacterium]